jgi:hypothetical protein
MIINIRWWDFDAVVQLKKVLRVPGGDGTVEV